MTDNSNVESKLELRRHFLRRYHANDPPSVFDACKGDGVLWETLRSEFEVASYWGVDLKRKRGTPQIDSTRVLRAGLWTFDVVDIDAYGLPWSQYQAVLDTLRSRALTVFLTIGHHSFSPLSKTVSEALRLPRGLPPGLRVKVRPYANDLMLAQTRAHAEIVEAVESDTGGISGRTRYVGLRIVGNG